VDLQVPRPSHPPRFPAAKPTNASSAAFFNESGMSLHIEDEARIGFWDALICPAALKKQ
jgi:hypothetical protein